MLSQPDPSIFLARELSPEARLILLCAHSEMSPEMIAQVTELCRGPLNWELVLAAADKHRVIQLLYKNLTAVAPKSMPEDIRSQLRHQFYINAGTNLKLAHALLALLARFKQQGIPVIPFKGCILASGTYGKLAWRQNYDIDLFVHQQDMAGSHQLLLNDDYVLDENFDGAKRYQRAADGIEIDLHWEFTPRYFHHVADFNTLYARCRVQTLLDQDVDSFSSEDFLLILCLQLAKDCWERQQQLEHLSKVCDIAEHLRTNPDLDWSLVSRNAQKDGLERIFHCGLIMVKELLGADLPPGVVNTVQRDLKAQQCVLGMCRSIFTGNDSLSPLENPYLSPGLRFRQLRFYLGIRERFRERVRHLGEIFNILRWIKT